MLRARPSHPRLSFLMLLALPLLGMVFGTLEQNASSQSSAISKEEETPSNTEDESGLVAKARHQIKSFMTGWLQEKGIGVDWQKIDFNLNFLSFTRFRVQLKATDLELKIPKQGLQATLSTFDLPFVIDLALNPSDIALREIGPALIEGKKLWIRVPATSEPKEKEEEGFLPQLPELPESIELPHILGAAHFHPIDLSLTDTKFVVENPDSPSSQVFLTAAHLKITSKKKHSSTPQQPAGLLVALSLKANTLGEGEQHLQTDLHLDLQRTQKNERENVAEGSKSFTLQANSLRGDVKLHNAANTFELTSSVRARVDPHLNKADPKRATYDLSLSPRLRVDSANGDKHRFSSDLHIKINPTKKSLWLRAQGTTEAGVSLPHFGVLPPTRHYCEVFLNAQSSQSWPVSSTCELGIDDISVGERSALDLTHMGLPLEENNLDLLMLRLKDRQLLENIGVKTEIKGVLKDPHSQLAQLQAEASLTSNKLKALDDLVLLSLQASAQASLDLPAQKDATALLRSWKISTELNASAPEWQTWKALLDETSLAIPASLNTLSGPVTLRAKAQTDNSKKASFKGELQTQLKGPGQSLVVHAKSSALATLSPDLSPTHLDVDVDVELSDVLLQVPDLGIEQPPQLAQDSRFREDELLTFVSEGNTSPGKLRDQQPQISTSIRVTTPPQKPLRLDSNMVDGLVPIDLDASAETSQAPSYHVRLNPFSIELFRRKARVVSFEAISRDDDEVADVKGLVKVDYSAYKITIAISGTAEHPAIRMSSEPALPESSIYSVLLFGRPLDFSSQGSNDSVAAAQQAVASGALTLASLYYLASTPIESFSYNPQSGAITANFSVGDKTSVSFGATQAGDPVAGLQRRLIGNWFLSTGLESDKHTGKVSASSFLEYFIGID